MIRRAAIAVSIACILLSAISHAQTTGEGAAPPSGAEAAVDSSRVQSLGMMMLMTDERFQSRMRLSFSSRPELDMHTLLGYRMYRASTYEMALQGAGAGMTMGAMAGAFGMMTGAWDEREAWAVTGAAAALGAIVGTVKSDDAEWNIRIRWDPDR
jgi:hypothetical protein